MTKASDNEFPSVLLDEQASAPTTPGTGLWRVYAKSDGLYIVDDAGNETGPLSTGGGASSFSGARVSLTADESTSSGTPLFVPWDQADYDTDSFWSAGNPTRLTIPTTGYYLITGILEFDNAGTKDGVRQAVLREGGTTFLGTGFTMFTHGYTGSVDGGPTIAYQAHFTASQYIEIRAFQDSGSAVDLELAKTHLAISLLGT